MDIEKITGLIRAHYRPEEYPALDHQIRLWQQSRPLAGIRLLDATPVFRNTLVKYMALLAAGAELSVGISAVMAHDKTVVALLHGAGIGLCHAERDEPRGFDLILDCAGSFAGWDARIGYVELTRSGVPRYEGCEKPVYVADSGRIKRIETSLGTGESYFRAMRQLGYHDWPGRSLVVFGSGKVGTGLILHARRLGARITVVTDPQTLVPSIRPYLAQVVDFRDRDAVGRAIASAYAVVTATGTAGALCRCCDPQTVVRSAALLANMGVEDEFGADIPAERVLNGKKTLNFILEEPTQMKYIDATMALHNAGALYLATHSPSPGLLVPDPQTEDELLKISRTEGLIAEELAMIME